MRHLLFLLVPATLAVAGTTLETFPTGFASAGDPRGQRYGPATAACSTWTTANHSTDETCTVDHGDWFGPDGELQSSWREINPPLYGSDSVGFRAAGLAEPRVAAVLLAAALATAIWRFLLPNSD